MSLAIVHSCANAGIKAISVSVETHISNGLPHFSIVGLPETAVKESKDRVRSALINANYEFPTRRITVNLAPADLPKEGGCFDLPIALSILAASGQIKQTELKNYEFVGELALSGELRPIHGALPFAIGAKARERNIILPIENAAEAGLVNGLTVYGAKHLLEVCGHLEGKIFLRHILLIKVI
ncbi:MAG: Competence protein ComM [Legionellaceae bacterium]